MTRAVGVLLSITVSVAALGAAPSVSLRDVNGAAIDPFRVAAGTKAIVFVFTSIDCPISNRYAPVIRQLTDTFGAKGVQVWLVYPNPFDTPDGIRKHLKDFSYRNQALLDPDHALAKVAKAKVTPEAAVFDPQGRELYHGRIDDRYVNLAVERPAPTRHDLEDALNAALAGKPVIQSATDAVGCFIADFVK
jgi:hypothetical protein